MLLRASHTGMLNIIVKVMVHLTLILNKRKVRCLKTLLWHQRSLMKKRLIAVYRFTFKPRLMI